MTVVYVAGPYRAKDNWQIEMNVRRAEALALEVWRMGGAAICPHANTRFFQGTCPDDVWLTGDLEILRRCDAVLLSPGWDKSEGTMEEVKEAMRLSIPVFTDTVELEVWMHQWQALCASVEATFTNCTVH